MLFAISGSQGSGKSTVLNKLKQSGFGVIGRKSSRSILEDWNVTLEEVNNNIDLTLKFQDEIIRRKQQDEQHAVSSSYVEFTERTFADLFTYALVAIGKDNKHNEWLNNYYNKCLQLTQTYSGVFYLKGGLFPVECDGVRASNHHYSRMVDLTMVDITKQMIHNSRLQIINTANITDRVNIITQHAQIRLEKYNNN